MMTRALKVRTAFASASILALAFGTISTTASASAPEKTDTSSVKEAGYSQNTLHASSQTPQVAAQASYFATRGKVVIYYNASRAPSFSSQIRQSAQIWNNALTRVEMRTGGSDMTYQEGNFAGGSSARWSRPGHGSINIDFTQARQNSALRVVSHETGHVLGNLPDRYNGICSELMSGGSAGPSCTNAIPNANERRQADSNY